MNFGSQNAKTRIEWIRNALKDIPKGQRILDAGAGEMAHKPFCSHLEYISQDFCQYEGQGDGRALQNEKWNTNEIDIVSDISEIPEPDESFHAILCSEVFEHIPEPIKAIAEFRRLLKKGGKLILTAPFCSLSHQTPFHFYSGFNASFYETLLVDARFEIVELTRNGNYFDYISQEISRIQDVAEKYCNKKRSPVATVATLLAQVMLHRLSSCDSGSGEVLCFGYHVIAKKR